MNFAKETNYENRTEGATSTQIATDDVKACVQEMCRCMHREQPQRKGSWLYRMIYARYMPRNERDVVCYMKRYKVWCMLPTLVYKRLKREEEII